MYKEGMIQISEGTSGVDPDTVPISQAFFGGKAAPKGQAERFR